ncbi:MAG: thioesterase family protein [Rhodobacteraceae bacterium]|nr:thioesterase family protein [Paracoccaceae bacterium]
MTGQPPDRDAPLARFRVPADWIDHNGHMNESRYLLAASDTTDAFLAAVGVDLDYIAAGQSYYTVESHIRHLAEARLGEAIAGHVRPLAADQRRLHLFTTLVRAGEPVATVEQMLLHVDRARGRSVPAPPAILTRIGAWIAAWAGVPPPAGAGRSVGAPRAPESPRPPA